MRGEHDRDAPGSYPAAAPLPARQLAGQLVRCAATVVLLAVSGRLHLRRRRVGQRVRLTDGRLFSVYRETTCDPPRRPTAAGGHHNDRMVTLAVWFHLKGVPAGARVRRWLFERESILNTVLYAGFAGYRVKLWMVDPDSCDYAGLYEWAGAGAAERYARYITSVLRLLSVPGSVGAEIIFGRDLDSFLVTDPVE